MATNIHTSARIHTCTQTFTQTVMHMYTFTQTSTQMYTNIHTCSQTFTQAFAHMLTSIMH